MIEAFFLLVWAGGASSVFGSFVWPEVKNEDLIDKVALSFVGLVFSALWPALVGYLLVDVSKIITDLREERNKGGD